jgi:phosphotransferase system enzyme I (PtsP)
LPDLLREVDFVSLGTNDLMQFVFAADRGTPSLARRYDFLSPAMLELVAQLVPLAAVAGVPVSVCGEVAGRPLEAIALAGLGITTLSMPATGLPRVKEALAALDLPTFRAVLVSLRRTAGGAASLREPIAGWAREHGLPI